MGQAATRQEEFWECCSYGREWRVRQMLQEGKIDVNWVSNVHQSCPIHVASQGKTEIVKALLEARCVVDARDSKHNTALHHAAMTGHQDIVELLLKHSADINAVNDRGWTPLIMACYFCQPTVVRFLLKSGADSTIKNLDGRSCLHELCRAAPKSQICQNGKRVSRAFNDQSHLITELLATAMHQDTTNGNDEVLLNTAPRNNTSKGTKQFKNQRPPSAGPLDRSRFNMALVEIAECLLDQHISVDAKSQPPCSGARGEADFTPLMFAVFHGHLPLARCLLDHGADVGAADMSGWTALHWAVNRENFLAVELLISYGANPERRSLRGETPLDLASEEPNIRLLLQPVYPEIVSNGYVTTDDEHSDIEEGRARMASVEDML